MVRRIGIVGYGHLGQYLTDAVIKNEDFELAFVWNRTTSVLEGKINPRLICRNLDDVESYNPDLIVEVAHPEISEKHGEYFLSICDYLIGSPTTMASVSVERKLKKASTKYGLYIPAGALWGGNDITKMADQGTLKKLKITMKKHPSCFRLCGYLKERNKVSNEAVTLYEGPVRDLCELAPNNVNTMAAASIAAHNLGFDKVIGCLISDPSLKDWHVIEVDATGPTINENEFSVRTVRHNPANQGVVTGSATYLSFLSSLYNAKGKGHGVHLC